MKAKLTLEDGTEFNVTVDESELKKETNKRWKPEEGGEYWFVHNARSRQCIWGGDSFDLWHYSQRNVFRTEEEAEQHLAILKARAAILDHADEVNEGWEPDWSDTAEAKYAIFYSNHSNQLVCYYDRSSQTSVIVHYKSEEAAQDAINKVGDAYLTVLGVKK